MLAALQGYDALVTPTTTTTAPDMSTTGQPVFNAPFSYAGFPSLTLPAGLGNNGMPIGVQLIGRPWAEETLLAAAAWVERQLAFDACATFIP